MIDTSSLPPFYPSARAAIVPAAALLGLLLAVALMHGLANGAPPALGRNGWLALHIASVVPAVPLGAWVLARRKGDALHRLLGRLWAVLMLVAALSSFGLTHGRISWIHLLSILVLVTVPRGVLLAMRGHIAAHRRSMTLAYWGLVIAGFFTFLPGRLMGLWLYG